MPCIYKKTNDLCSIKCLRVKDIIDTIPEIDSKASNSKKLSFIKKQETNVLLRMSGCEVPLKKISVIGDILF